MAEEDGWRTLRVTAGEAAFLVGLSDRLRTQDGMGNEKGPSHMTGNPVYLVMETERVLGVDPDFHEITGFEVQGDVVELDENGKVPENVEKVAYVERRVLVEGAVALTREGIERYLALNGHNLCDPSVFVASAHRCAETIELVSVVSEIGRRLGESR